MNKNNQNKQPSNFSKDMNEVQFRMYHEPTRFHVGEYDHCELWNGHGRQIAYCTAEAYALLLCRGMNAYMDSLVAASKAVVNSPEAKEEIQENS